MKALLATLLLVVWMADAASAGYNDVAGSSPPSNRSISNLNVYGSITLVNTVWEDMRFPATVSDAGGLTKITWNATSNSLDFADTCTTNFSDDHLAYVAQFPHGMATNVKVNPHVHFYQRAADQTNYLWYLRYRWTIIGGTVGPWVDHGFATNTMTFNAGQSVHQYADFDDIQLTTNMTPSTIMDIKLHRANGVSDGKVSYKEFDIHYQSDKIGTDTEYE